MSQHINVLEMAREQLSVAAQYLELDAGLHKVLSQLGKQLIVHFPVVLDNGEVEVFEGYRVQHNAARGLHMKKPLKRLKKSASGGPPSASRTGSSSVLAAVVTERVTLAGEGQTIGQ
jgi:hypothetical protein